MHFLRQRINDTLRGSDAFDVKDILTGDAKAGEAYFNGEGRCTTCHSVNRRPGQRSRRAFRRRSTSSSACCFRSGRGGRGGARRRPPGRPGAAHHRDGHARHRAGAVGRAARGRRFPRHVPRRLERDPRRPQDARHEGRRRSIRCRRIRICSTASPTRTSTTSWRTWRTEMRRAGRFARDRDRCPRSMLTRAGRA